MDGISNRIKELRKKKKWTQTELAEKLGVGKTTVSNYETGYSAPDSETLVILANLFEVSVDYVIGRMTFFKDDAKVHYKNIKRIPLYRELGLGEEKFLNEYFLDFIDMSEEYLNGEEYFALRIRDNSMNNFRLYKGDVVLVVKQDEVENGDLVVIQVDNKATLIRRFYKDETCVTLVSGSSEKSFEPRVFCSKKIKMEILGKVVWAIIKF